jgi:hypothetical protein
MTSWTSIGLFLAMCHFTAHCTDPSRGNFLDQVSAAHNANQFSLIKHDQPLDTFEHEDTSRLFQIGLRSHTNYATGHDVTDGIALSADDIELGYNTHHCTVFIDHRQAANTVLRQQLCCLLSRLALFDRDNVSGHYISNLHRISNLLLMMYLGEIRVS